MSIRPEHPTPGSSDAAGAAAFSISRGTSELIPPSVQLWLDALTHRDGHAPSLGMAARIAGKFDRPTVRFAVARFGEQLAGFSLTTVLPPLPGTTRIAYLELLAVDPRRSSLGLGRALLDDAVATARTHGYTHLELDVREGNDRALRLYESIGMTVKGPPEPHPLGGLPMVPLVLALRPDAARRAQP